MIPPELKIEASTILQAAEDLLQGDVLLLKVGQRILRLEPFIIHEVSFDGPDGEKVLIEGAYMFTGEVDCLVRQREDLVLIVGAYTFLSVVE